MASNSNGRFTPPKSPPPTPPQADPAAVARLFDTPVPLPCRYNVKQWQSPNGPAVSIRVETPVSTTKFVMHPLDAVPFAEAILEAAGEKRGPKLDVPPPGWRPPPPTAPR